MIVSEFLLYAMMFVFGMCMFSFYNVVIYRVPKHIQFVKGRSFCPDCGHNLKALDLVPVFSYIFLRGKCRYCKAKISPRYMAVEILGGFMAVFSYVCNTHSLIHVHADELAAVIITFAYISLLTIIAFIDADTMEISNVMVVLVLMLGVINTVLSGNYLEHIIGIFVISVPMLILTIVIDGAFGGGDIKLMAAIGLYLGWRHTLVGFFITLIVGGIAGAYLLITKKKGRKDHFAFGPYICVGCVVAALYAEELINWYLY